MSNKKKTIPNKKKPNKVELPVHKSTWWWLGNVLGWRSMLAAVAVAILVYNVVDKNSGYQWVTKNYLQGNWEHIRKYPNATLEERNQMKLGFSYVFLNYIVKHTPDTAIILFPLKKHITENANGTQLTSDVTAKNWATYFIYPRRIVYKDDKDTDPLYSKVTHVAICAAHGYEDLDYQVFQRAYFDVLPKKAKNENE
jgi:hypothetical protein